MKGSQTKTKEDKRNFECVVTRAKEVKEGTVAFDMEVNGVKVYGCWYKEGTNKDGKEYQIVNLPQEKGKDGEYYSIVWFPMSKEVREDIIDQLQKLV